jgi:hypothetical protein
VPCDICQFWASGPCGPFPPIRALSQSLLKYYTFSLWHLLILKPGALRPIFPNLGPSPHPYWNITHSLYDICHFWARASRPFSPIWALSQSLLKYYTFSLWHLPILGPRASRPIFLNLGPLPILTEIWHILFMTFANSGPQGVPAHFPQSGLSPNLYWNMKHSLYDICQFWVQKQFFNPGRVKQIIIIVATAALSQ